MAEYIEYHPLKFWLDPASIAEIVAHIQTYLANNPINSTTEIETIIHDYLIAHPELIGGVDSVNGQTGEVVLTADNISGGENVTIKDVLDSLQDQIDDIGKITENYSAPALLEITAANYPGFGLQSTMYISNRIIPAGSIIESVDIQSLTNGTIVLIDSDNRVVYTQVTTSSGDRLINHVINYTPETDVRFGFAGMRIRFSAQSSFDDSAFATDGLYESANVNPVVGDTLTVTKSANSPYRFCIQWHIKKFTIVDKVESVRDTYSWLPIGLQFNNAMLRYAPNGLKFGLVGRWYDRVIDSTHCKVTNNCGSEIYFKTKGATSITVSWKAMTSTNAYYCYSIDGGTLTRALVSSGSITLPNDGEHIVRLVTDGITENIGKWINGTGFAFAGVAVDSGTIEGVIPLNPHIMFLGDSIVEGIRALGIDNTDMGNTNSATGAFPWFCCEKLNAISYRVGYGASGLTVNGSFQKGIDAVQYFYSGVPTDRPTVNAIVIEYGENDGGASSSAFITAYNALLDIIKVMYSGIRVYLMIPLSQKHASDIRSVAQAHEWCTLIETADWSGITYADGTHPLSAGAEVAGNYLADFIKNDVYGLT